jgi:ABC-type polysaccharide transport system permease subunit
LGFISSYPIATWWYVCYVYPNASFSELKEIFDKEFMFGIYSNNTLIFQLIFILFGFIAAFIFGAFLNKINKIKNKNIKIGKFILYLFLLILFSISTFLNTWSIL